MRCTIRVRSSRGPRLPEHVHNTPGVSEPTDVKEVEVWPTFYADGGHVRGRVEDGDGERSAAVFRASALSRTVDHRIPVVLIDGGVGTIGLVDITFREPRMKAPGHALGVALEPSLEVVARRLFDCLELLRREIQVSAHPIFIHRSAQRVPSVANLAAGRRPDQ